MQQHHGLFVPSSLVVDGVAKVFAIDTEALLRYMHLIIFGYRECLFCHSQRRSVLAVQQHMMGRGHCRMDLEGSESEFRELLEDVQDKTEENEDEVVGTTRASEGQPAHTIDDRTRELRLSSGKVLSHRATGAPPRTNRRPLAEPTIRRRDGGGSGAMDALHFLDALVAQPDHATCESTTTSADNNNNNNGDNAGEVPPSSGTAASRSTTPTPTPATNPSDPSSSTERALTRTERRALKSGPSGAVSVALSHMTAGDRTSLAHLSRAEQRSMLFKQFRQQDKMQHDQRRYWSKFFCGPLGELGKD